MKDKTYDEWRQLGYQVRKGEKATGRNKKLEPTFTREQVDERFDPGEDPVDEDRFIDIHGEY